MAWVHYNPNPVRSDPVGDCAVRAISKAFDISWERAHVLLDYNSFLMGDVGNANSVIGATLRQHGFKRFTIPDSCPDCYTIAEFARDNPAGTFVVGTGNHVVAVVNGDYFDSWNSGGEIPIYAWYKAAEPDKPTETEGNET